MALHQIFAPAKVNLSLKVVGKRDDGYHFLKMIMVPLTIGDDLTIAVGDDFSLDNAAYLEDDISLTQDSSAIPLDGSHLCVKAVRALRKASGINSPVSIHLIKRIPLGAGLGGGSSDAAAVLRALNEMWGLNWEPDRLSKVGESVGADVPFFCWGRPALVEGIGERVQPCGQMPNMFIILVNPGFHVSTPWVFSRYNLQLTEDDRNASIPPLFKEYAEIRAILSNDLESVTAVAYPEIEEIKGKLIEVGADAALMSGSGPTVFGVFEERSTRDRAVEKLVSSKWWVCAAEVM